MRVRTEVDYPLDWAQTMQNLGLARRMQGNINTGEAGAAFLVESAQAYRASLRVRTETDYSMKWAMTQTNMSENQEALANHASTSKSRSQFEAALEHINAALSVFDSETTAYYYEYAIKARDRIQRSLDKLDTTT